MTSPILLFGLDHDKDSIEIGGPLLLGGRLIMHSGGSGAAVCARKGAPDLDEDAPWSRANGGVHGGRSGG